MKELTKLFLIFCKIGLFTLGGGYAMLPLMERELVGLYLTKQDFLDITAVAQSAPGIMAINVAILTGYRLRGIGGAFWAACGAAFPSFVCILLIALCLRPFADFPLVRHLFMGMRPAVVALILVPVFTLARSAGVTLKTIWVCIAVAVAVWLGGISPILLVLLAVCMGMGFDKHKRSTR